MREVLTLDKMLHCLVVNSALHKQASLHIVRCTRVNCSSSSRVAVMKAALEAIE